MCLEISKWMIGWVVLGSTLVWGAGSRLPIVVKINAPGYVLPEYSFSETCSLYMDRVEIEYRMADSTVKEVRNLKGGKSLESLVSRAAADKLRYEDNLLCDAPTTEVYGHVRNQSQKITLYSTGGCGTQKVIREGGAAFQLMRLMESYCTRTH